MNDLQVFNFEQNQVRVIEQNGEPWFIGKDVAEILGYSDTFGALKKHVDDEDKQNCQNDSFETPRGFIVINESGLYSLILSSKLPTAKQFKHWITSEVIPSSRKHGAYMTPETIEKTLTNPDFIIQLAQQLKSDNSSLQIKNFIL